MASGRATGTRELDDPRPTRHRSEKPGETTQVLTRPASNPLSWLQGGMMLVHTSATPPRNVSQTETREGVQMGRLPWEVLSLSRESLNPTK